MITTLEPTIIRASSADRSQVVDVITRAFAADPRWAVLTPRLPLSGLLPDDPDLLHRILAVPGGAPGMEEWRRLAGEGLVPAP